jgi:hypothetical protein
VDNEALLDKISRSFSVELPMSNSMDDYLDQILPLIRPWSEDLYEEEYYLDTRWLEIRDDEHFHETILHIFRQKGEYMIVRDGDINGARWKTLANSNTMILDAGNRSELYDLAFMNADFFILRKHGDQARKGMRKYFVLARENLVRNLEWRDIMELMFNLYRSNSKVIVYIAVLVVIVAAIIIFSIL